MSSLKNIIVTGSNKGIGLGIAEHLARQNSWNVILAVRNLQRGEKALHQLKEKYPKASLHLQKLDISDSKSIDQFVEIVRQKYNEIHVLVNNAGVLDRSEKIDLKIVKWTFATNFYGTVELSEKILPLLAQRGKIVSLGSGLGRITFQAITNEDLKKRWRKAEASKKEIFDLVQEFEKDVEAGNEKQKGWPNDFFGNYGLSKLALTVYHSALTKNEIVKNKEIQVYIACPGYVDTDMSDHQGTLTIEEGTRTPVMLIESPFEVKKEWQGAFFSEQKKASIFDA